MAMLLQRDGTTRSIDMRVFKMFLFPNSEKVKTMVAVQPSSPTKTLFSQGRYFLFNAGTRSKRLCCSLSSPGHCHTVSTMARHTHHQEDLL